jgi:hypothetical protein
MIGCDIYIASPEEDKSEGACVGNKSSAALLEPPPNHY